MDILQLLFPIATAILLLSFSIALFVLALVNFFKRSKKLLYITGGGIICMIVGLIAIVGVLLNGMNTLN